MTIAPPDRGDFYQSLARDRNDHAGAVRGIVHRRKSVPPVRKAAIVEHEAEESVVMVLGFGVKDRAKLALFGPLSRSDDLGPVEAGLRHHVLQAGALHGIE